MKTFGKKLCHSPRYERIMVMTNEFRNNYKIVIMLVVIRIHYSKTLVMGLFKIT